MVVTAAEGSPEKAHVVDVVDVSCTESSTAEIESGCRICHLRDDGGEGGVSAVAGAQLVKLGCRCKGELATAHRQCAEAWFWVRGNRSCEICGENAENIAGKGGGREFMQQWQETAVMNSRGGSSQWCCFCRSQSFCNLLVACLIILFILPWFLHNHIL